jgi:hypothetical protein
VSEIPFYSPFMDKDTALLLFFALPAIVRKLEIQRTQFDNHCRGTSWFSYHNKTPIERSPPIWHLATPRAALWV